MTRIEYFTTPQKMPNSSFNFRDVESGPDGTKCSPTLLSESLDQDNKVLVILTIHNGLAENF